MMWRGVGSKNMVPGDTVAMIILNHACTAGPNGHPEGEIP